jgi:hypothetical protein
MSKKIDIENTLRNANFSRGREKSVWSKIQFRLQSDIALSPDTSDGALSLGELDEAAGGLAKPEYDNKTPPIN